MGKRHHHRDVTGPIPVSIEIEPGVTRWTPEAVWELLQQSARDIGYIGPDLTVFVQTQYSTSIATSAGTGPGPDGQPVYKYFSAFIYLDAREDATFGDRPEFAVANEYGKAWFLYWLYLAHQGDWAPYLDFRGLTGDPRLDTSLIWDKLEIAADDYRQLFGSPAAIEEAAFVNPNITHPHDVPGFVDFMNTWGAPTS